MFFSKKKQANKAVQDKDITVSEHLDKPTPANTASNNVYKYAVLGLICLLTKNKDKKLVLTVSDFVRYAPTPMWDINIIKSCLFDLVGDNLIEIVDNKVSLTDDWFISSIDAHKATIEEVSPLPSSVRSKYFHPPKPKPDSNMPITVSTIDMSPSCNIAGKNMQEEITVTIPGNKTIPIISVKDAILRFMEHKQEWIGTSKELFDQLNALVGYSKGDFVSDIWPLTAQSLGEWINRYIPKLKSLGINIVRYCAYGGEKIIAINNIRLIEASLKTLANNAITDLGQLAFPFAKKQEKAVYDIDWLQKELENLIKDDIKRHFNTSINLFYRRIYRANKGNLPFKNQLKKMLKVNSSELAARGMGISLYTCKEIPYIYVYDNTIKGNIVKLYRLKLQLTQEKLAQLAGIKEHYITKIERNAYKPNAKYTHIINRLLTLFSEQARP